MLDHMYGLPQDKMTMPKGMLDLPYGLAQAQMKGPMQEQYSRVRIAHREALVQGVLDALYGLPQAHMKICIFRTACPEHR